MSRRPWTRPDGAERGERGAVLDEALLLPVPPDEVRDPVDVGVRSGRDRGEAHRRQRREGRDRAAVAAVVEQEAERRRVGRLEHRRRQAVDHDQDDRLRAPRSVTGEGAQARVLLGCAAPRPQADAGQEDRLDVPEDRDEREPGREERARRARTRPGRGASRRGAALRSRAGKCRRRRRPRRPLPPSASSHWKTPKPIAAADGRRQDGGELPAQQDARRRDAERGAETCEHTDPVPAAHGTECTPGRPPGRPRG